MEIKITLSAEEYRIAVESGALTKLLGNIEDRITPDSLEVKDTPAPEKVTKNAEKETKKAEKVTEPEEKVTEPEPVAEEAEHEYTQEDVRAKLSLLLSKGKPVADLLKEFGVKKLPDLDKSKYAALMERAETL